MSYIPLIIALAALLVFSAFFSASETAFSAANRIKLKNMAGNGDKRAKLALRLLESYDKLLSTVLIGNNIVNICSSTLAAVLFVRLLGNAGPGVATVVMTVLVLLFGEISPKTLAKEAPEKIAMAFSPLLRFFMLVLGPLNALARHWRRLIVRVFRVQSDRTVTEDELLTFVEEAANEGGINRGEEEMIRQVIEFDDITAREICTPRVDIVAVPATAATAEIEQRFIETRFSRLPVYGESVDDITGVLLLKDFYREVLRPGGDSGAKAVARVMKPVVYVSGGIKIHRLLHMLQQKQCHMAVLVDEYGGTVGIVTIEDIMEELVGEIWDEHDEVIQAIRPAGDGSWTAMGSASLEDLFEAVGIKEELERDTTVGNWVLETLGVIPHAGDSFFHEGWQIRVARVDQRRVMEIQIRPATAIA